MERRILLKNNPKLLKKIQQIPQLDYPYHYFIEKADNETEVLCLLISVKSKEYQSCNIVIVLNNSNTAYFRCNKNIKIEGLVVNGVIQKPFNLFDLNTEIKEFISILDKTPLNYEQIKKQYEEVKKDLMNGRINLDKFISEYKILEADSGIYQKELKQKYLEDINDYECRISQKVTEALEKLLKDGKIRNYEYDEYLQKFKEKGIIKQKREWEERKRQEEERIRKEEEEKRRKKEEEKRKKKEEELKRIEEEKREKEPKSDILHYHDTNGDYIEVSREGQRDIEKRMKINN